MLKLKLYLWLASINLFISSFTFGGGYVIVPIINKYFVEKKELFTNEELIEMAAVAQSSPGAIAINLSFLTGNKVAGISGGIISVTSSITPPMIILALISNWYDTFAQNITVMTIMKGMQVAVTALIIGVIIDMYQLIRLENSRLLIGLIPLSFIANTLFKLNVVFILLFNMGICLIHTYFQRAKEAS
ncbi:chromate transporter [Enterococcus hirae]|nr:chromate transporter [Enterococcus hirae]